MKLSLLFILTFILIGCSASSGKKTEMKSALLKIDSNRYPITKLRPDELKLIHIFTSITGDTLGRLYGKEVADSTFSDFLISKEVNKNSVPIYSIEKTFFQNTRGKEDVPINADGFYGYYLIIVGKDYMSIEMHSSHDGRMFKADPLTIRWNKDEKAFKVFLTP